MTAFTEVFNNVSTTLASAIDDSTQTVPVTDPAECPGTFPYFLTIAPANEPTASDVEIVEVTGKSGSDLTVNRGSQGTTPIAHDAGELVELRPTAGLFQELQDAINVIEGWDTDDLPEGVANLYFTEARAQAAVASDISTAVAFATDRDNHTGDQLASTISDFATAVDARLTNANIPNDLTLDNITQITTRSHASLQNLSADDHTQYHNDSRALTWLGTRSTTDLPEGTNLYYTDERAQDAIGSLVADSTSIDFTYDDGADSATLDVPLYYRKASSPPSPLPWRLIVDEGTTNRLTNPRFASDLTDWSEYEPTGAVTATRVTSDTYIGAGACEVVVSSAGSGGIGVQTGTYAVTPGVAETASVWVRGAAGGESVQVQLVGDSSGATSGSSFGVPLVAGEYKKLSVAKTPGVSDTTFRIRVVTTAATTPTFYVGAAQLETKAVSTSYTDPTLGAGHTAGRLGGLHNLGEIAAGSGAPFQVASDGAIVASNEMVFRGERVIPISIAGDTSHFRFQGAVNSQTSTWGDEVGVVKIRNEVNGNVLYVDADAVTTQFGVVISAGGLTTGAVMVIAAPSDLSSFDGDFFQFPSKSGLVVHRLRKDKFKFGSNMDTIGKWIEGYGGGKWSTSTTALTGTISSSGTTVTGVGTNFDPEIAVGDVIVAAGQKKRVTARASDTSLTTATAFNPAIPAGTAAAKADAQYSPFMYMAERSTSTLTDGTADHLATQTAAPISALLVGSDGRWRTYRGTSNGTVPAPTADSDSQPIVQTIARDFSQVAIATTDETSCLSGGFTVPGGIMGTTGMLRLRVWGRILRSGGDTFVLRATFGSTTVHASGNLTSTNNATRQPFEIVLELGNNAATNAQKGTMRFQTTTTIASTPVELGYLSASEDTTTDKTLDVTVDWSATDANSIFEKEGAILEVL